MNIRFSRREGHGPESPLRLHLNDIVLPRNRNLVKWRYTIDWLIDSLSHEYIHGWLKHDIVFEDLPESWKHIDWKGYTVGATVSNAFDNIREKHWHHSPDRAGLHLKAEYLEQLDYENLYELLADT